MSAEKRIKTAIQAMEDIKATLLAAEIPALVSLTGSVYLLNRPLNSKLEDIVINTVYFDAEQLQEGYFNLNIHVPNLKGIVVPPNTVDNTQPDLARMAAISSPCIASLDDTWLFDAHFAVDNAGEPIRDTNDWYLNIGIRYWALRLDKAI